MTELTSPKSFLDKNWKLVLQVLLLIVLGIIIILGILIFILIKTKPPQETLMDEILRDLTVPEEKRGTLKEVSPEAIKDLTTPPKKETSQDSEEIIKDLTAPK